MEDNNLWLRHLLNLVVQVTLTLYVFWKTFDILDSQLLAVAAPIYVAGLIKYGERTWTLYSGCREYLSSCNEEAEEPQRSTSCGDVVASYALNTVLLVRGLFVGRTLFHLRPEIDDELVDGFQETMQQEGSLKIVMAELDMMYDLLYTKAMVLQSRWGRLFRCIADTSMVVAFVLFQANHELHRYNRDDRIITYTLFAGALFMEAYSISMVIVSPWTRASLKTGSFLLRLSWTCSACSVFNAIGRCTKRMARWRRQQQQEQEMSSFSMGQFNLTDYSMSQYFRPELISKGVSLFGFEKQERNIFYMEHVKDKGIIAYVESLFSRGEGSQELYLGRALLYVLKMPFEHSLFRLHIYTHLYLSSIELQGGEMALVAAECMKLANYLMYLMVVCPYMLPVGSGAQDLESTFTKWVRDNCNATSTKREILEAYTADRLYNRREPESASPFASLLPPSVASLRTIKETWARLLIYAAAKCPIEMHARQLSNGVEPITFLSFLMLHHAEGDAGKREVSLFKSSDDPYPAPEGRLVSMYEASWRPRPHRPRYAFEFCEHALQPAQVHASLFVAAWETPSVEIRRRRASLVHILLATMEQPQVALEMEPAQEIGQFDDATINTPEAGYMTPEIEHISRPAIAQDPTSIARVFGWVPSAIAFVFSASIARVFGWVPSAIAFFSRRTSSFRNPRDYRL